MSVTTFSGWKSHHFQHDRTGIATAALTPSLNICKMTMTKSPHVHFVQSELEKEFGLDFACSANEAFRLNLDITAL